VVVTRLELESILSPEIIEAALNWGESTNLQDVINQILTENYRSPKN
jgi:hypothetical protein